MRIAVLADIHGNYRALQTVLADVDQQHCKHIFSLGDNIGYGPEPEEVVCALRERGVVSVMGNHELALVSRHGAKRMNGVAWESLCLTRTLLSQKSWQWLADLPPFHVAFGARFVHGCPPSSMTIYLFEPSDARLHRLFATYSEQLCFAGHTHDFGFYVQKQGAIERHQVPFTWESVAPTDSATKASFLILPGSVGQPRDSVNKEAKYLLWDLTTNKVKIRSLFYDVASTVRLLNERGFPLSNSRRLL